MCFSDISIDFLATLIKTACYLWGARDHWKRIENQIQPYPHRCLTEIQKQDRKEISSTNLVGKIN
jgi:hypothetical protein